MWLFGLNENNNKSCDKDLKVNSITVKEDALIKGELVTLDAKIKHLKSEIIEF